TGWLARRPLGARLRMAGSGARLSQRDYRRGCLRRFLSAGRISARPSRTWLPPTPTLVWRRQCSSRKYLFSAPEVGHGVIAPSLDRVSGLLSEGEATRQASCSRFL